MCRERLRGLANVSIVPRQLAGWGLRPRLKVRRNLRFLPSHSFTVTILEQKRAKKNIETNANMNNSNLSVG